MRFKMQRLPGVLTDEQALFFFQRFRRQIKHSLYISFILFLCSCVDNQNKNQAIDNYVNREVSERIKMIRQINKDNDTIIINPLEIDKRVNELVLLSKDVENLSASVNLSNHYFLEMAARFNIDERQFKKLNTGMHVNDISSTIKQNEMVLFNEVILSSGFKDILLHTAK